MAACCPLQIDAMAVTQVNQCIQLSCALGVIALLYRWLGHDQLPGKWQSDCTFQDMEKARNVVQGAASALTAVPTGGSVLEGA